MASGEYSDLPDLNLSGVEEVMGADSEPKVIGCGSYAEVLELRFHGLKCAGKRFHKILYNETKSSNKLARSTLEESVFRERRFLATVRHPHIVQFLGVYMSKHSNLPVLVMEYLHTTLNECIEKYHILPETVAYTILEDIALALCYLHSKFIAHRDLSSNNILLTVDMHAKISDLGMAKILNITPKQKAMTTKPGTLYCMPPEVLLNNPTYKVEIDIFSYGVLAMEIFCGESPVPTNEFEEDSTCSGDHRFRRLTEIARRQKYMDVINPDHPMVGLIEQCLDEADKRPIAADVKAYIRQEKAKLNIDCYSKIEMLQERRCQKKKIEKLTNEQRRLTDEITDFKFTVTDLKQEIEVYKSEPSIDKLREEIETLRKDLNSTRDMLRKRESEVSEKTKHLLNRGEKYHERMHELEKQRSDAMKSLVSGEQLHLLHDQVMLRVQKVRDPSESIKAVEIHAPMTATQSTLITSTLYMGGGQNTADLGVRNQVLTVNCTQLSIGKLPECPVIQFGLGNIGGKLLAIGGRTAEGESMTNKIYAFDSDAHEWKESAIPALSKPRARVCVVSQTEDESSACIAACGGMFINGTSKVPTNLVEVYRKDSPHWTTVTSLPKSRAALRMTVLHNTVYLLGGYEDLSQDGMHDCFSIPTGNLFHENREIVWSTLQELPSRSATPAHICGTLLAIGGKTTINSCTTKTPIHAYNPNLRKWIQIADLPMGLTDATAAALPCGKVLVAGGWDSSGNNRNKNVFSMELVYRN